MKKFIAAAVAVVFLALSIACVPVYAESIFDKAGDWWATRGKSEPEKSLILAQRQSSRAAKRAENELRKASKQMEKSAKQMQKEAKSAWGR